MKPLLIQQPNGNWQIGHTSQGEPHILDVDLPEGATLEQAAGQLAAALKAAGHSGEPVVLGLASAACLVGTIPIDRAVRSRDHQQLLFALEEPLPWAAEEMEADFQGREGHALGVATRIDVVRPLVEALERHAIVVQSIAPVVLLATQHSLVNAKEPPNVVLWRKGSQVELVELTEATPTGWQSLPACATALAQQLNVLSLVRARTLRVMSLGMDADMQNELVSHWQHVESSEAASRPSMDEAATAAAGDVLSGKLVPWFDLRRGALGSGDSLRPVRRSVRFLVSAAAVLMICLSAACLVRAQRYQQQLADYREQQETLFREALPGQRIPGGIRSRLESEQAKLAGLTGRHVEVSSGATVLSMLHDALSALPAEMRFRVVELHLTERRLDLEGEVRAHGDADQLATRLRQHGFTVEPPRTQQLPARGVSVSVDAEHTGTPAMPTAKDT